MSRFLLAFSAWMIVVLSGSCMRWDYGDDTTNFDAKGSGLFIICEGDFQYGNATLSYYDPKSGVVENEVFYRANGMRLGDVAQSMTIYDGKGWIVVNNSHVVFAIDPDTFRELGRIENLTSPRYIHFVNKEKAYVSQLWDNRIFIVNPSTYSITGYIEVPGMAMSSGSTEQMVQSGKYVYCNCWSYQNKIIRIDTETDTVDAELTVGIQPKSLVIDARGRLWTITDGGYEGSPYGYEPPALFCIDTESFSIVRRFDFNLGDTPSELQTDISGNVIYWLNDDVWEMNIDSEFLPSMPIVQSRDIKYYGLSVNPVNGEIYVADAIDYMQQGIIYRYSSAGELIDSFYVGVVPGAFCWK